jgi:hypothetical protein
VLASGTYSLAISQRAVPIIWAMLLASPMAVLRSDLTVPATDPSSRRGME